MLRDWLILYQAAHCMLITWLPELPDTLWSWSESSVLCQLALYMAKCFLSPISYLSINWHLYSKVFSQHGLRMRYRWPQHHQAFYWLNLYQLLFISSNILVLQPILDKLSCVHQLHSTSLFSCFDLYWTECHMCISCSLPHYSLHLI